MRDSFKYLGSEWFLYVTTIGDRDGSLFTGLTMRHEPRDEDCQFSYELPTSLNPSQEVLVIILRFFLRFRTDLLLSGVSVVVFLI
ncbi:hypothetical protein [Corynebacterium matruchotii]|jgi:hypothetical protein|uniref:hypothetical protein n=1 Tax=Corynebacterium matruchotii TaxID=43768 RepID=UPI0005521DE8|nr:hypothetical protein [Corynebacterium matruchotii]